MESPNTRLAGTLGLHESKSSLHSASLQGEDLYKDQWQGQDSRPVPWFQHARPTTLWAFASKEVVFSEAQFPHL